MKFTQIRFNFISIDPKVATFHEAFPGYNVTPLHPLADLEQELQVSNVCVKDESNRFGLPSFKVLGASWGVYRAVASKLGVPITISVDALGQQARNAGINLITCSEGNWGRAVGRVAKYMGIPVTIVVPSNIDEATGRKIAGEGATIEIIDGSIDDAIDMVIRMEREGKGLLVIDHSWKGYEEIPRWVVEGYETASAEVDKQVFALTGRQPTHVIVGVGVGSWASSVVLHYKSQSRLSSAKVVTVEPDSAACLQTSLKAGKMTTVQTGNTIMCGFNCGTVSETAWPRLRDGVDVSITVTDEEADTATRYLNEHGINGGPCGAATLAALKNLICLEAAGLDSESVVVLLCSEGWREYTFE